MLASLRDVKPEIIKQVLLNDAQAHVQEGCYLEYLWLNDDDADEVLFLFRVNNLDHAKKFINEIQYQVNRLVTFFYKLPHISIW